MTSNIIIDKINNLFYLLNKYQKENINLIYYYLLKINNNKLDLENSNVNLDLGILSIKLLSKDKETSILIIIDDCHVELSINEFTFSNNTAMLLKKALYGEYNLYYYRDYSDNLIEIKIEVSGLNKIKSSLKINYFYISYFNKKYKITSQKGYLFI